MRQLTIRNQSTKDNVGTLPIFAYATPDPPQQPLNFSAMVDQSARLTRTGSITPSSILVVQLVGLFYFKQILFLL